MRPVQTFVNEQADWFVQECESVYRDLICECVDGINGRMCDALDGGVVGKEFEDAAYDLVKQTAEVLVARVGSRVGKDLIGIMQDLFNRMVEAPCGHTAVCVDPVKQHIWLNREDNLRRKRMFWLGPIGNHLGVLHAMLTEAEIAEMRRARVLYDNPAEAFEAIDRARGESKNA